MVVHPSGRCGEKEICEYVVNAVRQPGDGEYDADDHGDLQRELGEGHDALRGELDEPLERVLADARPPHARDKGHLGLLEAHPFEQSAQELVVLPDIAFEHVDDFP